MGRYPTGNPMGRPTKNIDWGIFESLCGLLCTQSEICSVLQVNTDTINTKCKEYYGTTFSEAYKIYSECGKASLRRTQNKLAQKSAAMAIWLGKQMLDQKEPEKKITEQIGEAVLNEIFDKTRDPVVQQIVDLHSLSSPPNEQTK